MHQPTLLLLLCCCCCMHTVFPQDVLVNAAGQRYIVLDMLGSGTFGQVVSAYSEAAGKPVAVKVSDAAAAAAVWWWWRQCER
jgi:uncharacterized protein YbjT (DUF2867 family)